MAKVGVENCRLLNVRNDIYSGTVQDRIGRYTDPSGFPGVFSSSLTHAAINLQLSLAYCAVSSPRV